MFNEQGYFTGMLDDGDLHNMDQSDNRYIRLLDRLLGEIQQELDVDWDVEPDELLVRWERMITDVIGHPDDDEALRAIAEGQQMAGIDLGSGIMLVSGIANPSVLLSGTADIDKG